MSNLIINPYSVAASFTGILDTYSGAEGAYSVRRLNGQYNGKCLKVRRSNDNTESDIGFDSLGYIDESALTTFVGANSAYVTTWYDQSGNGRDATQSTSDYQPRIVNSGTVDKINNKVAVRFDYTDDGLNANAIATPFSGTDVPFSQFSVYSPHTDVGSDFQNYGLAGMSTSSYNPFFVPLQRFSNNKMRSVLVDNSGSFKGPAGTAVISNNTQYVSSSISSGTAVSIFHNGNSADVNAGDLNVGQTTLTTAAIGMVSGGPDGVRFLNTGGHIQEVIIYASDKSSDRTGIRDNINTYFSVY